MAKAVQVAAAPEQSDINFERGVLEALPEFQRCVTILMAKDLFAHEVTETTLIDMKARVRGQLAPFEVTDEDFNVSAAAIAKLLRHQQETRA